MITTDIDFPDGLPYPLLEDRTVQHVSPFIRTTMQSGRSRSRRTFTSVPSMQGVSWVLTNEQALVFEAWFREVADDGAAWFNCKMRTPLGVGEYVAKFAEMYRGPEPFGPKRWKIWAELELFQRPILAPGWGQFPEFILEASIIDLALNREWPEA